MGEQSIWEDLKEELKVGIITKKSDYPDWVSDKTLKDAIVENAWLCWPLAFFDALVMAGLSCGVVELLHISEETVMFLIVVCSFVIVSFVGFLIQRERKRRAAIFAEKYYKEAKLFRTCFVKVRRVRYGSWPTEYYLRMKDENGRTVTAKILQSQYEAFKQNRPECVYAIRLPKYKAGYFYLGYPVDTFENATSFLEEEVIRLS